MALSIASGSLKYNSAGSRLGRTFKINFGSSYISGGERLTASSVGLTSFESVIIAGVSGGYLFEPIINSTGEYALIKVITGGGSGGSEVVVYSGADIKGSANTNSENVDAAANPTNGALLKALDTFTNYAGTIVPTINPDRSRNIAIVINNDSGGPLDLFEGVTTFTITGTYRGAAQVEQITFTSTAGNKTIANTQFRYKYGVKPFTTVTNVTYDNAPAGGLKASLGIGSLIGLPSLLKTPAEADVTNITKNGAFVPVAGLVSTTNNTVNLDTLSDGDDFEITYNTASGGEVANGTDLSTLTNVPVEAYGY